jgi:SHS2 domain-containing protein
VQCASNYITRDAAVNVTGSTAENCFTTAGAGLQQGCAAVSRLGSRAKVVVFVGRWTICRLAVQIDLISFQLFGLALAL